MTGVTQTRIVRRNFTVETTLSEEFGLEAAREFIAAFNAQDHERLARSLNYPHTRLAGGRFRTIGSAADFAAISAKGEAHLQAEGWDHTTVAKIEVVHAGDDKVHVAMTNDRCHGDGTVYNSFDTLWIATNVDGHWGIQFRSSFLR